MKSREDSNDIPKLKAGENIKLLVDRDRKEKKIVKGKIIQVTDYIFCIQTKLYRESFMFNYFIYGRIAVI